MLVGFRAINWKAVGGATMLIQELHRKDSLKDGTRNLARSRLMSPRRKETRSAHGFLQSKATVFYSRGKTKQCGAIRHIPTSLRGCEKQSKSALPDAGRSSCYCPQIEPNKNGGRPTLNRFVITAPELQRGLLTVVSRSVKRTIHTIQGRRPSGVSWLFLMADRRIKNTITGNTNE